LASFNTTYSDHFSGVAGWSGPLCKDSKRGPFSPHRVRPPHTHTAMGPRALHVLHALLIRHWRLVFLCHRVNFHVKCVQIASSARLVSTRNCAAFGQLVVRVGFTSACYRTRSTPASQSHCDKQYERVLFVIKSAVA